MTRKAAPFGRQGRHQSYGDGAVNYACLTLKVLLGLLVGLLMAGLVKVQCSAQHCRGGPLRDGLRCWGTPTGRAASSRSLQDSRMHNTFNTHQLLHWAGLKGRKLDLKLALFTEHFTNQCNVSDDAVLVDFAAEIGLDRAEAVAVLEDQHFANDVRSAARFSQQQGNVGAPAIVFDQKHLVTGAQGVENYSSIPSHLVETKG